MLPGQYRNLTLWSRIDHDTKKRRVKQRTKLSFFSSYCALDLLGLSDSELNSEENNVSTSRYVDRRTTYCNSVSTCTRKQKEQVDRGKTNRLLSFNTTRTAYKTTRQNNFSIVACVFIAAGTFLQSGCLAKTGIQTQTHSK
jgi:hypothetical protein